MSRPLKPRNVCELPEFRMFGPKGIRAKNFEKIVMTIGELETIRLLDHEGLNQEEAAKQMNVARTTVQRIYLTARQKIADCIINGKVLIIDGGDYVICSSNCEHCEKPAGFRRKGFKRQ